MDSRLKQAFERFEAWWAGSSLGDRPIVICRGINRPSAPPPPVDDRPRSVRELDPQWATGQRPMEARALLHLAAETLPVLNVHYANNICIPAVFLGGEIEYHETTTWIRQMSDVYERGPAGLLERAPRVQVDHGLDASAGGGAWATGLLLTVPALLERPDGAVDAARGRATVL